MSLKCPKCGTILDGNPSFCGSCGYEFKQKTLLYSSEASAPTMRKPSLASKQNPLNATTPGSATMKLTADTLSQTPEALIGHTVGEFTVSDLIGRGGMGWVYLGVHPIIGKKAAIKVLKSSLSKDPSITESFVNEAKAATAINNRYIVDVFSFGKLPTGNMYFAMEYLEGVSLSDYINEKGKLDFEDLAIIVPQILEALEAAHDAGIIHRDLKPENIFLSYNSKNKFDVKLLDFGIAKFKEQAKIETHQTQAGVIKGTPFYMSPEQCKAEEIDARADIYAFGVIMYLLLTGKLPFYSKSYAEVIADHLSKQPLPPSAFEYVPKELERLVLWTLEKDKNKRPANINELKKELVPLLEELAFPEKYGIKPKSRLKSSLLIIFLALLITAGLVYFFMFSGEKSKKKPVKKKHPIVLPTDNLNILSAHPSVVNREIEYGFKKWMKKKGHIVSVHWIERRDWTDYIRDQVKTAIKTDSDSELDIVLGGGESIYLKLANERCIDTQGIRAPCLRYYRVPKKILKNIPDEINGIKMYDPKGYWYGTALSGFGIVCSLNSLNKYHLKMPTEWEDLANPEFKGHVVSANPSASSSTHMVYELILQTHGWNKGWQILVGMAANLSGNFIKSSKGVIEKIAENDKDACGPVIDYFYYLRRKKLEKTWNVKLYFHIPDSTYVFSPDPVGIINRAQNLEAAAFFIDYMLTEGQQIWITPKNHSKNSQFIPRLPVNKTLYKKSADKFFYTNPFTNRKKIVFDLKLAAKRKKTLKILMQSALVDNYESLSKIKRAYKLKRDPVFNMNFPIKEKYVQKLTESKKIKDPVFVKNLEIKWLNKFNRLYKRMR